MKRSSGPRKTASNPSESTHHQLNMYAIAVGAAGVSVLALAQPAGARIVYTPSNVNVSGAFNLDVNNDGIVDFTIINSGHLSFRCIPRPAIVSEQPTKGNGAEGSIDADALVAGAHIGHNQLFYGGKALMARAARTFHGTCGTIREGFWNDVKGRYLGLAFKIHGKTHYGWARLTVELKKGAFGSFMVTLTGYAYETIPGKSLKAGQRKEAEDVPPNEDSGRSVSLTRPIPDTPQPASLGMLALGAQGVPLWRRKESVDATQ